jgi:hypothetical protein
MRYLKIIVLLIVSCSFSCNNPEQNPKFSLEIIGEDTPEVRLLAHNSKGLTFSAVQPEFKEDSVSQKVSLNGVILLMYRLNHENNSWILKYTSQKEISILDNNAKWKFVDESGEKISRLTKSEKYREISVLMKK